MRKNYTCVKNEIIKATISLNFSLIILFSVVMELIVGVFKHMALPSLITKS